MSTDKDSFDSVKQTAVAWTLALSSGVEIVLVIYLTLKEIFKKTGDSYVLKDQYTIYFVTLVIIGLSFKLLIIDALFKDEIKTKNSCSIFLSTFVPDFFVALAYACMMLKTFFLLINFNDTKQSYQQNNKKRKKYSNIGLLVYLGILLVMMFLRCCNTCQRDRVQRSIEEALPFLSSRKLITILITLKNIPLITLSVMLVMLALKDYFKSKRLLFGMIVG